MNNNFYIEINATLKNHYESRICGDVFITKRIYEENRVIAILSDGMGHGVKANLLATITATMALNYIIEHKNVKKVAETIIKTLPECNERQSSYSTFTIIDIEIDGYTTIIEYENPPTIVLRGEKTLNLEWEHIEIESNKLVGKIIRSCKFLPKKEDRIIFFSDGVAQSGLGIKNNFGWEKDDIIKYIQTILNRNPIISALDLSKKIVNSAAKNDNYTSKDDTSCAVVYYRNPRKLLICTGPPYEERDDKIIANKIVEYEGKKVICGATTANIVARELNEVIIDDSESFDSELPPPSNMNCVDIITEGVLTLSKVFRILNTYNYKMQIGKGPADRIVNMIFESDEIDFLIGTKINIEQQKPEFAADIEFRSGIVKRISEVLKVKYLKTVNLEFI